MGNDLNVIDLPLADPPPDGPHVVSINVDELPLNDISELLFILENERPPIDFYLRFAVAYYRRGNLNAFRQLIETGLRVRSTLEHLPGANRAKVVDVRPRQRIPLIHALATFNVQASRNAKDPIEQQRLLEDATSRYNEADKIHSNDELLWLGKGVLLLAQKQPDRALYMFNTTLERIQDNLPALIGKASVLYGRKEFKESLNLYKKALRLLPSGPAEIRLGMGLCYFKLGHLTAARACFERVLTLSPNNVSALVSLAILDINEHEQSKLQSGVRRLKVAYDLDRTHPVLLNQLANHFFYKRQLDKVAALAAAALNTSQVDSVRAESSYHLARVHHLNGEYDRAFTFYQQAVHLQSDFSLAQYGLGQMWIHRGDLKSAIPCFESIHQAEKDNLDVIKILGSLYGRVTDDSANSKKALTMLKRAAELQSDDAHLWLEYAIFLEKANDITEALRAYEKVLSISAENNQTAAPELLNNIAALEQHQGNLDKASSLFEEALTACDRDIANGRAGVDPQYFRALRVTIRFNIARCKEERSHLDEAVTSYRDILKEVPDYMDCHLRLGHIAQKRGNNNEATDAFKDAIGIDEDARLPWIMLANLQYESKAITPCRKTLERVLTKIDRHDMYSLIAMGNVYWRIATHEPDGSKLMEQNLRKSIEFFTKALSIEPKNPFAANGMAMIIAQKGYYNEAREVFSQVRQASGSLVDVWINLGHVLCDIGQYAAAVQTYEHCLTKLGHQNDVQLLLFTARACYLIGKVDRNPESLMDARRYLEQALAFQSEDIVIRFNLALSKQEYGAVVLKRDQSQRSMADVQSAMQSLTESEKEFESIYEALAASKASVNGGSSVRMPVDSNLVRHRAKYSQSLITTSQINLQKQIQEDTAKSRRLQQMQEEQERLQREETEKTAALEAENARAQVLIEQQRAELALKAKQAAEKLKAEAEAASIRASRAVGRTRGRKKQTRDEDESSDDDTEPTPELREKTATSKPSKAYRTADTMQLTDEEMDPVEIDGAASNELDEGNDAPEALSESAEAALERLRLARKGVSSAVEEKSGPSSRGRLVRRLDDEDVTPAADEDIDLDGNVAAQRPRGRILDDEDDD